MKITFLSPEAAIIGLAVAVPVIALALAESRARVARSVLRLAPPVTRGTGYVAAIGAFAVLVALGAAQPVLQREKTRSVRKDAEVFFVVDTSKSMQASGSADGRQRLDRAREIAKRMRGELSDVPAGVASITDRVLLHLFPTANDAAFHLTLDKTLGIERPPSVERGDTTASNLETLTGLPAARFFQDAARHRVLVLLTDAETRPFNPEFLRDAFRRSRIETILVRVGSESERVYERGVPDPRYHPPAGAEAAADRFADAVGGVAFDESEVGDAIAAARTSAGAAGPKTESREVDPTALSSYAFGLAFLPLAFLLWRRNLT